MNWNDNSDSAHSAAKLAAGSAARSAANEESTPMDVLKRFWTDHPVLSNWLILAVGMVIILYFSARHIAFLPTQWAALIGVTIGLAGLCAWIINWE